MSIVHEGWKERNIPTTAQMMMQRPLQGPRPAQVAPSSRPKPQAHKQHWWKTSPKTPRRKAQVRSKPLLRPRKRPPCGSHMCPFGKGRLRFRSKGQGRRLLNPLFQFRRIYLGPRCRTKRFACNDLECSQALNPKP